MPDQLFYTSFRAASGYRGDFAQFAVDFGDIFSPIPPMIALHSDIRRGGYPTFVFSNTNSLAVHHVRQAYPFFSNFSGYILSYEHRCMKPEPELYEVVERCSGFTGPDILYMDDRPENVEAGARRGWQTILHVNPDKTWNRVRDLGLLA